MKFTTSILIVVFCFSAISASDGTRLIEGYVFDHKTQRTIGNVDIKLDDGAVGTTTDERGRFVLRLSEGVHRLSFFRVGYGLVSREVRVSGAKLPILYVEIIAREIVMDTIDVVAKSVETRFEALHEATGVLSGDELQKKYSLTLAETMKNEIGVAIRSMGPAPARPVIRGLSGDRVQINIDGIESHDLSATSADHAVTLEPFNAERLEIIRGPRTLLHTASAIGGVINVVKQKIPEDHPQRVFGSVGAYGETANRGYLSAAGITVPVGPLALYAETTYRNTRDVQTPIGRLANTPIDTRTHLLGLSYPTDRGYIGASFDQFDTQYGIPGGFIGGHPNGVDLDIDRRVFDGKAAFHFDREVLSSVEVDLTRTFYHHFEYESSGSIGSEFLFHDYRGDLKLFMNTQGQTRNTVLALGFGHHNLKLGGFVFTPPTREQCASLGLYHEFIYRDIEFQASARYTYTDFDPRPSTRSIAALGVDRTFHAWSAAISPLVTITDRLTGGFNFSRSQRVPRIEELYNHGPHLAAYTFEVGNIDLEAETSLGFEVFFHYLQPGIDFVLSGYWNEFDTYIAPRNTGEINFAQLLPIYAADGVAARFLGLEMHLGWRLNTRLNLELDGSYVRGENKDEQVPLPEMPPLKFVGSTTYQHPYLTVGGTAEFVAGQERVDIFEEPTDGYAVFGIYAQRDINTDHTRHSIIISVDNLLDTEYRNHLSRIRSVMPETGRSIKVHYKMFFF